MFFVMKCLKISFNNTVVCISQGHMHTVIYLESDCHVAPTNLKVSYQRNLKNQQFPERLKEVPQLEALISYTRQSDSHHYIYNVCYWNKTLMGQNLLSSIPILTTYIIHCLLSREKKLNTKEPQPKPTRISTIP